MCRYTQTASRKPKKVFISIMKQLTIVYIPEVLMMKHRQNLFHVNFAITKLIYMIGNHIQYVNDICVW